MATYIAREFVRGTFISGRVRVVHVHVLGIGASWNVHTFQPASACSMEN